MGQDPNKTDGKSCLSVVSPWPNLEELCWAEQSADLSWSGCLLEGGKSKAWSLTERTLIQGG